MSDAVVIIGGGTAGAAAALKFMKYRSGYPVVLVEKEPTLSYAPSYPLVTVGKRHKEDLSRSTLNLQKKGISVILETVHRVDTRSREVITRNQRIKYRALILAPGAEYDTSAMPELARAGYNIHRLEDAENAFRALQRFSMERVVLYAAAERREHPLAVYEVAFLLDSYFRKKKSREDVSISLFFPESTPAPLYGDNVNSALQDNLMERRIQFYPRSNLTRLDPDRRVLHFNHIQAPYDLLLYSPPLSPPPLYANSGLAEKDGWLTVNPADLSTSHGDVYVIGNAARVVTPSGAELPKMGVLAYSQAATVARNLNRKLRGKKPAGPAPITPRSKKAPVLVKAFVCIFPPLLLTSRTDNLILRSSTVLS